MSAPGASVAVTEEDVEAVLDCYRSGWLTMGPRTKRFEEEFAALVGTEHAIAVSSGSAARHLALLAAGVGPGDEVIVSGLEAAAVAGAVAACGARLVACDVVGPANHTLAPGDVARRTTERTRAVLAGHRWGYACDVGALGELCDERGVVLLEDCGEAVMATLADGSGRQVGSAGLAGCFSFSAARHLSVGEGGMLTTDHDAVATRVRSLRSHAMTSVTWDRHRGHAETYDILDIGFNYRLDEPRSALALSRLPRLGDDLASRRATVRAYRAALDGVPGLQLPWPDDTAVERSTHYAFGVLLDDEPTRDRVRRALTGEGIAASTFASGEDAGGAPRPQCEEVAARCLVLPLADHRGAADVPLVAAALRAALATDG